MRQSQLSEIKHRAVLIANDSIDSLHSELRSLHARNAAKGCLRSGATVKESARIAGDIIRQYFLQLETYIRELPGGKAGTDAAIVDTISESTGKLLDELWLGLKKTAALASDEKLVVHIQPQVESALVSAQELFRSNLRAFWSQRSASPSTQTKLLFAFELVFFTVCITLAVVWAMDPTGAYEPWVALFGLGGGGIDLYRRRARTGAR